MYDRRTFLTGIAATSFSIFAQRHRADAANVFAVPGLGDIETNHRPSLTLAAEQRGRYFGAATRIDYLDADAGLRDIVLRDCGSLTPEIHLKWNSIEYHRGEFNFTPVDTLLDFAELHGKRVRGHTLLWEQSTPDWARDEMLSKRDWTLVAGHFERVLTRYGSRIDEWDVINEPIDTERGSHGLRRNSFHRAFGAEYIERALREARAHAPNARLTINDYGFDYENSVDQARREAFLTLLAQLKTAGAPLDSVGLQAHLDLSKGTLREETLRDFMRSIAALGLSITITELDVKESEPNAPIDVRDARVAHETQRYLQTALAEPAVAGVITWGLSDRYSWLSENGDAHRSRENGFVNRGLPYDVSLAAKPMYAAIGNSFSIATERS